MLATGSRREALFAKGRPPKGNLIAVLTRVQESRGYGASDWRLISARRHMGRSLFDMEERSGREVRRIVGKICRHEKARVLYQALSGLWRAGLKPPEMYTVTKAIAFFPEQNLILQEKAPGKPALEAILAGGEVAESAAAACASWLARLQSIRIPAPAPAGIAMSQWSKALQAILADESPRISRLERHVEETLSLEPVAKVPSHGDFHGMNILIHADRRVTGIDLDKFSERDVEADPAYFLAETGAQGFLKQGCFEGTRASRSAFLKTYEAERGERLDRARTGAWMAFTFLQHLHFELALLKTGHREYAAPWIAAAESAVFDGNLELEGLK